MRRRSCEGGLAGWPWLEGAFWWLQFAGARETQQDEDATRRYVSSGRVWAVGQVQRVASGSPCVDNSRSGRGSG